MYIGTEKLTYTYLPGTPFAREALKQVSFSLEKGEIALLIGPSGSGKSTLFQHLNGLIRPSEGQVIFENKTVGADKEELLSLRRKVGLVFQMPEEHFFSETVYDEVAFAPRNLGLVGDKLDRRVFGALRRVGLDAESLAERHPFQLSSGQKRLVALASVLSINPETLVLDEPTAGLDPVGRANLFKLLASLNKEEKLTVIIATHHLDEAAALADRVFVLDRGELVLAGSRTEVFERREELERLGLKLPSVTGIFHDLAARGLPVQTAIFSMEEALQELKKIKRSRC